MRSHKSIFILGLLSLFFLVSCQKREMPAASKPERQTKITAEELENREMDSLLKELKQKNPFRPDHAVGSLLIDSYADNVLKGIIWDSQRPFAVIGDSVVSEGDYVDNKKVIRIDKDSVTLDNNGKEEILRLEDRLN